VVFGEWGEGLGFHVCFQFRVGSMVVCSVGGWSRGVSWVLFIWWRVLGWWFWISCWSLCIESGSSRVSTGYSV